MQKKGMTILEILVAMSIFVMIATMAVGAFVSVIRTKSLVTNMKDSQQKARIATEMITRLSRQANKVSIVDNGKTLQLTFEIEDDLGAKTYYGNVFKISGDDLLYGESTISTLAPVFSSISTSNLLGSTINLVSANSSFALDGTSIPSKLNILLDMAINGGSNPYYNDNIKVDTAVLLESIK